MRKYLEKNERRPEKKATRPADSTKSKPATPNPPTQKIKSSSISKDRVTHALKIMNYVLDNKGL